MDILLSLLLVFDVFCILSHWGLVTQNKFFDFFTAVFVKKAQMMQFQNFYAVQWV